MFINGLLAVPEVFSVVWYFPNLAMNLSPRATFAPTTFPGGSLPTRLLVVERRSSKQM